ncbi:5-carboxymethyl-2-hydroxymuconate isomerase [Limnohabitans sp. Rim8]|uniref:fumarylacetoacetate hydrolase family protein n=1 Tax=Limnohabitans sp. Rim8 TaxID=1100718 RepID=UPI000D3A623D|nr:fumarylacetoacetate hydrolase family protein [Limnohabitans sp. Rim8]PUE62129.1 5-carboxymethyl-2-hydroxymuconate isomerase [Limnohabitans sp. Rim8]
MKLVSYIQHGADGNKTSYGALEGDRLVDLSTREAPSLRRALATEGVEGLRQRLKASPNDAGVPVSSVQLLPPIPDPEKILCIGLNYFQHAQEVNMQVPLNPSVFVRYPNSFVGQGQPVLRPPESEQFDYEAEMAVVIGRGGRRIPEAQAMAHVAGYSCMAENSVRDWQRHSTQATPGKNFFHSGAIGPWLVTPDEIGDVSQLEIIGRLNQEVVQRDTLDQLIFSIPHLIAYLSTFTELVPGDVIATGTPAGVGLSRKPQRWLRPGDIFEVEITGLGTLRNPVNDDHIS